MGIVHKLGGQTLEQMMDEFHRQFAAAQDHEIKAGKARLRAADILGAMRERCRTEGIDWWPWFEAHSVRSRRDAERLLKMYDSGDPEAAHEEEKKRNREAQKKHRATTDVSRDDPPERSAQDRKAHYAGEHTEAPAASAQPPEGEGGIPDFLKRSPPSAPAYEHDGLEADLDEDPENYRTAYFLRADTALQCAVYTGPILSEDMVATAERVARAWSELADRLRNRLTEEAA
jgi:hypothetical protein